MTKNRIAPIPSTDGRKAAKRAEGRKTISQILLSPSTTTYRRETFGLSRQKRRCPGVSEPWKGEDVSRTLWVSRKLLSSKTFHLTKPLRLFSQPLDCWLRLSSNHFFIDCFKIRQNHFTNAAFCVIMAVTCAKYKRRLCPIRGLGTEPHCGVHLPPAGFRGLKNEVSAGT
jgi:hypothetical protein